MPKTKLSTAERIVRYIRRLKPSAFTRWLDDRPLDWRSNESVLRESSLMQWLNDEVANKFTKRYKLVSIVDNVCYIMSGKHSIGDCVLPDWMVQYYHEIRQVVKKKMLEGMLWDMIYAEGIDNRHPNCHDAIADVVWCVCNNWSIHFINTGNYAMLADKYECMQAVDMATKEQEQQ